MSHSYWRPVRSARHGHAVRPGSGRCLPPAASRSRDCHSRWAKEPCRLQAAAKVRRVRRVLTRFLLERLDSGLHMPPVDACTARTWTVRSSRPAASRCGPSISAAPRLTAHDRPPISRRLRRATCWALVPATVWASRHHRRTGREAHLSTVEAGPQAAARIPCPHGHRRRAQGPGQPTGQGPQAPVGLSWGRAWLRPAA